MTYRSSSGTVVSLAGKIGSGGEATLYHVVGNATTAVKIYHDRPTASRSNKIRQMLATPPHDPAADAGHVSIAWPVDVVSDETGVVGLMMPLVAGSKPLAILANPTTRRQQTPGFTWRHLITIAKNVATIVSALHTKGYVIGDLNALNFLVSNRALVTLIDCDSIQVPNERGALFLCPVGTAEFTPPELIGADFSQTPRQDTADRFSLAVLLFQLLMEGTHPFQGIWLGSGDPSNPAELIRAGAYAHDPKSTVMRPPPSALSIELLPPEVVAMFIRAFVDGHRDPQRRPSAAEWKQSLGRCESTLTTCSKSALHVFPRHVASCPWCTRTSQLGDDTWLAVSAPIWRPPEVHRSPGARTTMPPGAATYPAPTGFWSTIARAIRRSFTGVSAPRPTPMPSPTPTQRPTPRPVTVTTRPTTLTPGPTVVANRFTGKFHRPTCEWANRISVSNRTSIGSQEARRLGMVACKVCRPT